MLNRNELKKFEEGLRVVEISQDEISKVESQEIPQSDSDLGKVNILLGDVYVNQGDEEPTYYEVTVEEDGSTEGSDYVYFDNKEDAETYVSRIDGKL